MAGLEGRDAVVNLIEFLFYQDKAVVDKTGSIVGNCYGSGYGNYCNGSSKCNHSNR